MGMLLDFIYFILLLTVGTTGAYFIKEMTDAMGLGLDSSMYICLVILYIASFVTIEIDMLCQMRAKYAED